MYTYTRSMYMYVLYLQTNFMYEVVPTIALPSDIVRRVDFPHLSLSYIVYPQYNFTNT